MIEYQISSAGLSNPVIQILPQDFKFVVGQKEYFCNRFQADFISTKVAELHVQDRRIDTFHVDIDDKYNAFELIMKMMDGQEVEIPDYQIQFIRQIAKLIGNEELINKFSYIDKKIDETDVVQYIQRVEEMHEFGMDCTEEIDFIASNFHCIDNTAMDCMDINLLHQILGSPNLVLFDESKTFEFIYRQVTKYSREYIDLFKHLVFPNLSGEDMEKFCSVVDFETEMTPELFEKIKERLSHKTPDQSSLYTKRYDTHIINCEYKGDKIPSTGIFGYFRKTYKNPIKEKIIITTTSGNRNSPDLMICSENTSNTFSLSQNPTSFLCVQFTNARVLVNGYLFACGKNSELNNPQNWAIEGSNDGKTWHLIDQRLNNTDLEGNEKSHYWRCNISKPYSYIRWRMLRTGTKYTTIGKFELYGFIKY